MLELNQENFQQTVQSTLPVIVDFWAEWCTPCKMLAPVLEKVSRDFEGKALFAKVNAEDHPELASEHSVMGIPCLIVFSEGKELARLVGYKTDAMLRQEIGKILAINAQIP